MSKHLGQGVKYSKAEILWVHNLFRKADTDNDGYVLCSDFHEYIKKTGTSAGHSRHRVGAFRALDINKDGKLTFEEYLRSVYPYANDREIKVMLSWAAKTAPPAEAPKYEPDEKTLNDLKGMFLLYDKDRSGSISCKELLVLAEQCSYSREEMEDLFNSTDTNQDGSLSFEEFVELMKSCYL